MGDSFDKRLHCQCVPVVGPQVFQSGYFDSTSDCIIRCGADEIRESISFDYLNWWRELSQIYIGASNTIKFIEQSDIGGKIIKIFALYFAILYYRKHAFAGLAVKSHAGVGRQKRPRPGCGCRPGLYSPMSRLWFEGIFHL
jgi:hypothetical protein